MSNNVGDPPTDTIMKKVCYLPLTNNDNTASKPRRHPLVQEKQHRLLTGDYTEQGQSSALSLFT